MLSPFFGYITLGILKMDFNSTMILLSYIGVFLILFQGSKSNPIRFPRYLLFYLLFILYTYYSAFYQLDRDFKMSYLYKNYTLGSFILLFIVENVSINKKYYGFLFNLSKKILIIAILVIVIQQVYSSNFLLREDLINVNATETGSQERLLSIYSWTGFLGNGLSFIPIFLLVVEGLDKKKRNKKVLLWILAGIIFAILTRARWVMVNVTLVFVLVIISQRDKFKQFLKYLFIIPFILILSYFTLNVAGIDAEGIVMERILESNKKNISQKSAGTRLLAIKVFDKLYWKNAVFGVGNIKYGMGGTGTQNYELKRALGGHSSQIHVGYLSLFYMYGLIGGSFFLLFLFFLLKRMYLNAKKNELWAPFFGILGFAIANVTLVTFSFFEMGLIFMIIADKYFNEQNKINNYKLNK